MPKLKAGTVSCKATKWYPRVTAGPLRNQYIHRIVAAAMLGRLLTKDEEVHHRDGDRRNFEFTNLIVMGNKDHGWVSAKQACLCATAMRRKRKNGMHSWQKKLDSFNRMWRWPNRLTKIGSRARMAN